MKKLTVAMVLFGLARMLAPAGEPADAIVLSGHTDRVTSACFSPDGKTILSGGWDKTVRIWDVATSRELKTLAGHTDRVTSVCFSPDGLLGLSGSHDGTVRLWNLKTGKEKKSFVWIRDEIITCVAFGPNGKFVMAGTDYLDTPPVLMWRLDKPKPIGIFHGHSQPVAAIAVSPAGVLVLTADSDGLMLRDNASGKVILKNGSLDRFTSVAFSGDAKTALAGASSSRLLYLIDVEKGLSAKKTFQGHSNWVTSVGFSPDGKWAVSGSWDKTVKVWNLETGEEVRSFSGHAENVTSVCFSPDGKTILSGSLDKTLRLWPFSL